jgi:hypothetical protein
MFRASPVLIVPVLLGLAACQSAVQTTAMTGSQQECAARLEANPAYARIARHMPLGGEPATAAQLADHAIPGAADRPVLLAWKAELAQCRELTVQTVDVFAPETVPVLRRNYARSDAAIDDLILGRSTWADANKRRDAIAVASEKRLWPEIEMANAPTGAAHVASVTAAADVPDAVQLPGGPVRLEPVSLAISGPGPKF